MRYEFIRQLLVQDYSSFEDGTDRIGIHWRLIKIKREPQFFS